MNTYIFLGETTREKTPQNFLNIELTQDSVKPHDNSSSLSNTFLILSLENLLEWMYKMKEAHLYLYLTLDLKPN